MKKLTKESKVKTRKGYPARIICDDAVGRCPVIALVKIGNKEHIVRYTDEGIDSSLLNNFDLIEVSPYDDFKIDAQVMVRDNFHYWYPRHFAGVASDGRAKVFARGYTSFTIIFFAGCNEHETWEECRRPTEAELAKFNGNSNV